MDNLEETDQILIQLDASTREQLLAFGLEVFGNVENFYTWLWSELRPLGNDKPIHLIAHGKSSEIINLLGRIKFSTYS